MLELKDEVAILALVVSMGAFAFTVFKGRYDQITGVKPALVFEYDHDSGGRYKILALGQL